MKLVCNAGGWVISHTCFDSRKSGSKFLLTLILLIFRFCEARF